MIQVMKRDESLVPYDLERISVAIAGAFEELEREFEDTEILTEIDQLIQNWPNPIISVEEIQDLVETALMVWGYYDEAKAYIRYRYKRELARQHRNEAEILEMIQGNNEYWRTENSNKDARLAVTQRDYIAGIVDTDLARTFIFPREAVAAHDAGEIHIHDMDFSAERTYTNCCLVNLEDMLQNGTVINGVMIEKPHRLITAATIASQIIAAVSGAQYGGLTITLTHLAPFVRDSYERYLEKYMEEDLTPKQVEVLAMKDTRKEVQDAIQTLNYQINSFCVARAQTPFVSICMYLGETEEYKEEVAMLIEETLRQRIQGMKNEAGQYVTVAFPKLLYVLEEDNITEDAPYWYLTELAAECTAKRMVPDYISEKVMKEQKINPAGTGDCYPCMGCRSFLTDTYLNQEGKPEFYGRGNIGVTTVNLIDTALTAKAMIDDIYWRQDGAPTNEEELEKLFFDILKRRLELCHDVQRVRWERLQDTPAEVNPILWQYGALSRLEADEPVGKVIAEKHFTSSLGYVGLYETALVITGESHTQPKGRDFALRVLQFMNDKCIEWRKQEPVDYSVYGTPIETTTYKFARKLQEKFGIIPGITDRDYVTNSYHVWVEEPITPWDKIKKEAEFQKLSPGGCISYIETTNLQNNLEVILALLKFMYDKIMYCEFNTKLDNCMDCGFEGEIILHEDENGKHYFECPQCGNRNFERMNVARRVCGYISTSAFNEGRADEMYHRFIHVTDHNEEDY